MKIRNLYLFLFFLTFSLLGFSQPAIEKHGHYARIIVEEEPMLIIGGELGNSSASTTDDITRSFSHVKKLGLNTVLVPVSWCLIEPEEGKFDMKLLDWILTEARSKDLKVVLLWFGAWKNSMSCYTPDWIKLDSERFPRAHVESGRQVEELSSLNSDVLEADKKAFCKMLEYLRENDDSQSVIMIQVENEIGMIESPRDYSADANKKYNGKVPAELVKYIKDNHDSLHSYLKERLAKGNGGDNWADMFGNDIYAEEIFQTWTYAQYVQQLIEAGRNVYDLPMYVNVALDSRGRKPGQYPSGGPLAQLIDIWHCGAPGVDVLGVDIYDKDFPGWLNRYHLHNNPLFIPEIRLEDKDAMYALYAFGHHDAMGFCPFSIEDYPLAANKNEMDVNGVDVSLDDQLNAYSNARRSLSPLAEAYRLIGQAEKIILENQGTENMDAVLLDNDNRKGEIITPDSIRISVRHSLSLGWEPESKDPIWPEAACMIIRLGEMDYIVIGSDVVLTFSPAESNEKWETGDNVIGLLSCEEVEIVDSDFKTLRHLNGDQTHQGRHVRIPHGTFSMQRVRLYKY